jgi:hypothetical protein
MTKNITHLKIGKAISADPHYTGKTQGIHFTNTAKHVERHPTPSNSRDVDGDLSDKFDDLGSKNWRPMDRVTASHTYTGPKGSTRASTTDSGSF